MKIYINYSIPLSTFESSAHRTSSIFSTSESLLKRVGNFFINCIHFWLDGVSLIGEPWKALINPYAQSEDTTSDEENHSVKNFWTENNTNKITVSHYFLSTIMR